jgi:uncharacterized protein (DUF1330 family)
MSDISPDPENFRKLIETHDGPIVMLNLLKYKQKAEGEEGTGAEAYARYGSRVVKLIEAAGGRVLWSGKPEAVLIGESFGDWDAVALVQYPSPRALFEMGQAPEYQEIHKHRAAGLEQTALIACTPTSFPPK